MLIRITTVDGRYTFINPLHIVMMGPNTDDELVIVLTDNCWAKVSQEEFDRVSQDLANIWDPGEEL